MRVAVIGEAGLVRSHLVEALVEGGHGMRVVDNLCPQVHPSGWPPRYLNPRVEFVREDARDREGLERAIVGAEAIFHLAGTVGVGDSMYRIRDYAEGNAMGAANLLDILANLKH